MKLTLTYSEINAFANKGSEQPLEISYHSSNGIKVHTQKDILFTFNFDWVFTVTKVHDNHIYLECDSSWTDKQILKFKTKSNSFIEWNENQIKVDINPILPEKLKKLKVREIEITPEGITLEMEIDF